jgi:hypothetical protein
LDADKINALAAPMKTSQMLWQTPAAQEAMKLASQKVGGWDLLLKNSSNPRAALPALQALPDNATPQEQSANLSAMAQIESTLDPKGPLAEARKLVNDPDLQAVGPAWNQGSKPGQWAADLKALTGSDPTKFDAQNRLQTTLATGVLNTIKSFAGSGAGQIRTAELEYMEKNQPTLQSTPGYWNDWLSRAEKNLRQVYQAKAQMIPGAAKADFATPAPLPQAPPAPAAVQPPTQVKTAAGYYALPSGATYMDPTGTLRTKP